MTMGRCAAVASVLLVAQLVCTDAVTYTGETKVGILHSLTGTMAISEQTVVNADLMAFEEINAAGGLLGKKIVPVIEDGESDWDVFAQKAEQFANPASPKYVKAVFGCWTSASRKKVLPVFEKHNHMLFYPVQYEGQECSKNIFYTGAAPNQQIEPAVQWLLRNKGKQFFLVGSDYVFPRTANEIIKGQLSALGGETVGEDYLPLGESRNSTVGAIVDRIKDKLPNGGVIFNTLNGDSNVKFFHMLYDAGLHADKYPSMSVSITETEISVIGVKYLIDHYAAWNFFMSIKDNPSCPGGFDPKQAINFVEKYKAKYGSDQLVNDPMESAYISVFLWAQAVQLAGTFEIEPVRAAVKRQAYAAPEGEVAMQANHHISKFVRIGQVIPSGDFQMVYESTRAVFPEPWNFWVQSSTGHACDWTDIVNKGEFYKLDEISVALVHSLSGPNEALERQLLEAEMAAIKVINREGGVLGKVVKPEIVDAESDKTKMLTALGSIVGAGKAVAIFGSPPSAAEYDMVATQAVGAGGSVPLLFDPRRSFGGECSEHVIHTGTLINQQLAPALTYFSERARSGGKSSMTFFAIFPSSVPLAAASASLQASIESMGDVLAGHKLIASTSDTPSVVSAIKAAMPNGGVVLNLLDDASLALDVVTEMRVQNIPVGAYSVLFTGIAATDVGLFGDLLANQYVALPYVMAVEMSQNTIFLDVMREFYGSDYTVTDSSEAAYVAVRMWAEGARQASDFSSKLVLHELWTNPYKAPAGIVQLLGSNFLSKQSRLGTLNAQGTGFRVIAGDAQAFHPEPAWLQQSTGSNGGLTCDFTISLRTICTSGKGLISANGTFLPGRDGADNCDWCKPGSHSVALADSGQGTIATRVCKPCGVGTMQDAPGQDDCKLCEPGRFSDTPQSIACGMCEQGFYQDKFGETSCVSCGPKRLTLIMASVNKSECVCDREYYRACPTCECLPCPLGMDCEVGSDMTYYWQWNDAGRVGEPKNFPVAQSSHMALAAEPLSIFKCKAEARCPGGPPGSCGIELDTSVRSCAQCNPLFYWNGMECIACSGLESSPVLFPLMPILVGMVIVCFLYRVSRDSVEQWGSWRNGIACMAFIAVNHYQLTASSGKVEVKKPAILEGILEAWSFTDDMMSMFRPQCTGYNGFEAAVIVRAILPLCVLAVCVLVYYASHLVQKVSNLPVAFNKDLTINIYFSMLLTFFAAIATMSMALFRCTPNPNNTFTLLQDQSVICYESQWASMIVVGVLACLLYIVGFGCYISYVIYIAPSRFHEVQFQRRYKFLFLKFRPDVYWWALPFCTKGVLFSLGVTFFQAAALQLVWSEMILMVYGGMVVYFKPWRYRSAVAIDVFTHASLIILLSVLMWHSRPTADDEKNGSSTIITVILTITNLSPVLTVLYFGYLLKRRSEAPRREVEMKDIVSQTMPALRLFASLEDNAVRGFIESVDDWSRYYICAGLRRIAFDYGEEEVASPKRLRHAPSAASTLSSNASEPVPAGKEAAIVDSQWRPGKAPPLFSCDDLVEEDLVPKPKCLSKASNRN